MPFRITALIVFSISLIFGGIENTCCYAIDFRSDRLEEISKHISAGDSPHGDSTYIFTSSGRDIAIRVADGCVEHIGFRIFPEQLRAVIISPLIADFVERYWLSLTLPLNRQKSVRQQLTEDRFTFHAGNIESIDIIQQDTTLRFSCRMTPETVTMVWDREEKPLCSIMFPVNHELILGRGMLENDRRLPQEITGVRIKERPARHIGAAPSMTADSLSSLLIDHAGTYLDCSLVSERYYTGSNDGATVEPVFDSNRMRESIINLFTDYDIGQAANIRLNISHKTFGINEQAIETTIRDFVAYAMQNGCMPFVGTVSIDENASGMADVLVVMHNEQAGYNHILRATVPLDCVATGSGTATARLNAFVPSSNIKNLFRN